MYTCIIQGVQLYVKVIDKDYITTFNDTVQDDLIDSFVFSLNNSHSFESSMSVTKKGSFSTIGIMARVLCAQLFTGPNCEHCIEQNCSMRGVCVNEVLLTCDCDPGFNGSACEIDINECEGHNCSGNGHCVQGINSYNCTCVPGFTGSDCEVDINECKDQNCNGNGECIDGVDMSSCECNVGFTGTNCETNINDCESQTCSGNGHCIDSTNSYRCNCQPGFTGDNCEAFNYCAGVNCSGNGHCFNREDRFTCICYHGFTGEMCNVVFQAGSKLI